MCEGLSGSVRLEIEGSLVQYSQEVLCCVLEQDTLLFQPRKIGNCPIMTENLLTGTYNIKTKSKCEK